MINDSASSQTLFRAAVSGALLALPTMPAVAQTVLCPDPRAPVALIGSTAGNGDRNVLCVGVANDPLQPGSVSASGFYTTSPTLPAYVTNSLVLNVAPGTTTVGSTDGVNGGQLNTVNSSVAAALGGGATYDPSSGQVRLPTYSVQGGTYGNVGAAIAALNTAASQMVGQIGSLQTGLTAETSARIAADTSLAARINLLEGTTTDLAIGLKRLDSKIAGSTAIAIAMSGNAFLPGKSFNLTGNVGTYDGAHAGALQLGALVSESVALNAGIATNFNKRGSTGARVGFTVGW